MGKDLEKARPCLGVWGPDWGRDGNRNPHLHTREDPVSQPHVRHVLGWPHGAAPPALAMKSHSPLMTRQIVEGKSRTENRAPF